MKIGLLLPRSDMFPTLALNVINGTKLGLGLNKEGSITPDFKIEGVGTASDDSVLRAAEKVILQEQVDLTIAFCSSFKLAEMATIYSNYKMPLIHLDLGGRVLVESHASPFILHHNLNLWESSYAAGAYAAKTFGRTAAMIASYYDGGYHTSMGFVNGFTDNGGEIIYNYVAPMDYKSESFDGMIAGLTESKPDIVFALFSYNESIKVFEKIAESGINTHTPILALPLMTDEGSHVKDYGLENIYSVASWAFDDDNLQMQAFNSGFRTAHGNAPNIFGLLGYETGLVLDHALQGDGTIPARIGEALQHETINTPRGTVGFNGYHGSQVDPYKLRKFNFNNIAYHNTVMEYLDASGYGELHEQFADLPLSGWRNPYICT